MSERRPFNPAMIATMGVHVVGGGPFQLPVVVDGKDMGSRSVTSLEFHAAIASDVAFAEATGMEVPEKPMQQAGKTLNHWACRLGHNPVDTDPNFD